MRNLIIAIPRIGRLPVDKLATAAERALDGVALVIHRVEGEDVDILALLLDLDCAAR